MGISALQHISISAFPRFSVPPQQIEAQAGHRPAIGILRVHRPPHAQVVNEPEPEPAKREKIEYWLNINHVNELLQAIEWSLVCGPCSRPLSACQHVSMSAFGSKSSLKPHRLLVVSRISHLGHRSRRRGWGTKGLGHWRCITPLVQQPERQHDEQEEYSGRQHSQEDPVPPPTYRDPLVFRVMQTSQRRKGGKAEKLKS